MKLIRRNLFRCILMLVCWMLSIASASAFGTYGSMEFNRLTNRDGLSNTQVNAILKDSHGYVWLGTQSGLNRFDGFRMKTFFCDVNNPHSIPNNQVDEIQEDIHGDLWIHTSVGYCVFRYDAEQFDRKPEGLLQKIGVEGAPQKVFIDSKKNMWISVYGKGIYFVDAQHQTAYLFPSSPKASRKTSPKASRKTSRNSLPDTQVSCIREHGGQALVSFVDGSIYRLDGYAQEVVWKDRFIASHHLSTDQLPFTFVDNKGNYWVASNVGTYVYGQAQKKWFMSGASFLASVGIVVPPSVDKVLLKDVAFDSKGRVWFATDHNGLFLVDYGRKIFRQFLYDPNNSTSISDNSLLRVYVDDRDALWVGSYKNGVSYYSAAATKFYTIPIGDVCTITQDRNGVLWCGTNDAGIVAYHLGTGQTTHFHSAETGLGSEVVVSSTTMHDGSLYFGTYNGGLACYAHGVWKSYHAGTSGLCSNSVWCLAETPDHRLLIGTLGGGFQIFDPATGKFATYHTGNSKLSSNYISSVFMQNAHQALLGHSQYMSVFDFRNGKIQNLDHSFGGQPFISPSVNYAMLDSRGLLWVATPSGIAMYDTHSDQMEYINDLNGTPGSVGCAVIEDRQHHIWLVSEYGVTQVNVEKGKDGRWNLKMTNYNSLDGLQGRQFNYRSACLLHSGDIAIGGLDGVNIISPRVAQTRKTHIRALFSGLVLFDHALTAGEEYEGRVVLEKSLDASREIYLNYKDHAFTIQLAASEVTMPARCRFLYRMKGVSDKWLLTPVGSPEVTFTNLSSGSYTLQVKVVNGDGSVNDEISELQIHMSPPFYLSLWAFIVYILLIVAALYLYRRRMMERQRLQFERRSMEDNMKKTKELNELKLNFFTNVSHELRTPLTLILSPLESMIREEANNGKRRKLELIHRNATRLLNLVNQILDFRKFDQNKEKLNLAPTEMVSFIDNICSSFRILANNKVTLIFESQLPRFTMNIDPDKVGKILNNLLSNAYKFTPDGGTITVSVFAKTRQEMKGGDHDWLCFSVADTGKGISDEEKKLVFDRFYQINGTEMQPAGGSGIGLNLVKKFAALHGGNVMVRDNAGGGSVFVVELPIPEDKTANASATEDDDALYGMGYEAPQANDSHLASQKPVLLLVDDSDDFREFMRGLLSDYQVVEAVNGKDAWDKIIEQRPDIILSDVMMPVMDGNELCRQVKENDETASIPFVMLTARLADEHRKEGLASGADEYITKPFNIDMLNLRLRNLLNLVKRSGGAMPQHKDEPVKEKQLNNGRFVLSASDQRFLDQLNTYLQENMCDPDTSVESISEHLGISRVQLYKKLISLKGITPSEYLRSMRIRYAEELMRQGDLNVSEIAYKVGFNNPRYFSKYFQDAYGVTPSQYRKQMNGEPV